MTEEDFCLDIIDSHRRTVSGRVTDETYKRLSMERAALRVEQAKRDGLKEVPISISTAARKAAFEHFFLHSLWKQRKATSKAHQWLRTRIAALVRADWICENCKTEAAIDVDHTIPKPQGSDALNNLKAYCHPCHSRKTALRDGGFGNLALSVDFPTLIYEHRRMLNQYKLCPIKVRLLRKAGFTFKVRRHGNPSQRWASVILTDGNFVPFERKISKRWHRTNHAAVERDARKAHTIAWKLNKIADCLIQPRGDLPAVPEPTSVPA